MLWSGRIRRLQGDGPARAGQECAITVRVLSFLADYPQRRCRLRTAIAPCCAPASPSRARATGLSGGLRLAQEEIGRQLEELCKSTHLVGGEQSLAGKYLGSHRVGGEYPDAHEVPLS